MKLICTMLLVNVEYGEIFLAVGKHAEAYNTRACAARYRPLPPGSSDGNTRRRRCGGSGGRLMD